MYVIKKESTHVVVLVHVQGIELVVNVLEEQLPMTQALYT